MSTLAMQRPQAIRWFERLYLSASVGGFLFTVAYYGRLREWSLARNASPGAILIYSLFSLLVSLILWYLIARRASRIAKWVLSVAVVIGLLGLITGHEAYLEFGTLYLTIDAILRALTLLACGCLFRRDARAWFGNRGKVPTDGSVFE